MSVLSVRVPDTVEQQLNALATATGRSKSWLAKQAIEQYLALEAWQTAEIQRGLEEADNGDFADENAVKSAFERWQ